MIKKIKKILFIIWNIPYLIKNVLHEYLKIEGALINIAKITGKPVNKLMTLVYDIHKEKDITIQEALEEVKLKYSLSMVTKND